MIEQVKIQNFKSIGDVTVSLSPVTVIVGRSGTGKSNFLEAIQFLRNYLVRPDQAIATAGGWPSIYPAGGNPQPLGLELQFRLPGYDKSFIYSIKFSNSHSNRQGQQLQAEKLLVGDETIFAWEDSSWTTPPNIVNVPQFNNTHFIGRLPTLTDSVLAFAALSTGVACHDFPSVVLTPKGVPPTHRPSNTSSDHLDDSATNYLLVYNKLTQDLRSQQSRRTILARLQQINPTIASVELDAIQQPKNIITGHDMGGQRISLNLSQESDGVRRFLAHLLALYQTPPRQTLLFEEPENGIYPGALEILAEEFKAAAEEGRGQVILTTHSPGLLDHFVDDTSIRVVDLDPQTQQTRIGPLAAEQRQAICDSLLMPGELLTVDAARVDENTTQAGTAGA